jgi:hypothetical protein
MFAVAALGFALKHSPPFRQHFLSRICGLSKARIRPPEIALQAFDHSDLAIKIPEASALYVVEAKIGAKLEPKQDPHDPGFFKSGYGRKILKEVTYQRFENKNYVILQNFRDDVSAYAARELSVQSCQWKDLDPGVTVTDSLWSDLLESLGGLGISGLYQKDLIAMKNSEFTLSAAKVFKVLEALAGELEIDGRSLSYDVGYKGEDGWFGINLPQQHSALHALDREGKPAAGTAGWFGYECEGRDQFLSVWFYCASGRDAESAKRFLQRRFKGDDNLNIGIDGKDAWIKIKGRAVKSGDFEWFRRAFSTVR